MKKIRKISALLIVLLIALLLNPVFSHAAATTVDSEEALRDAINSLEEDGVIELSKDIALAKPIQVNGKDLTINGNGHTITKGENWSREGDNGTLITAGGKETVVTLKNLNLTNADKYGAQAYNGGHIIFDDVKISGAGFGAVLANAGTVEVKNLTLGKNGTPNNNGIEIAKGTSVDTEENMPTLLMNGTLNSTETENVVYIAINDKLSTFEVQNTETTTHKIFVRDNTVVITDENNIILFTSNATDKKIVSGNQVEENITLKVVIKENTIEMVFPEGTKLSREKLESIIDLEKLGISEYRIADFYTDKDFTDVYDFADAIAADTSLYAKLEQPVVDNGNDGNGETTTPPAEQPTLDKDETPKTGFESYTRTSIFVFALATLGIIIMKKISK